MPLESFSLVCGTYQTNMLQNYPIVLFFNVFIYLFSEGSVVGVLKQVCGLIILCYKYNRKYQNQLYTHDLQFCADTG
jgi:hypothetical protein